MVDGFSGVHVQAQVLSSMQVVSASQYQRTVEPTPLFAEFLRGVRVAAPRPPQAGTLPIRGDAPARVEDPVEAPTLGAEPASIQVEPASMVSLSGQSSSGPRRALRLTAPSSAATTEPATYGPATLPPVASSGPAASSTVVSGGAAAPSASGPALTQTKTPAMAQPELPTPQTSVTLYDKLGVSPQKFEYNSSASSRLYAFVQTTLGGNQVDIDSLYAFTTDVEGWLCRVMFKGVTRLFLHPCRRSWPVSRAL